MFPKAIKNTIETNEKKKNVSNEIVSADKEDVKKKRKWKFQNC